MNQARIARNGLQKKIARFGDVILHLPEILFDFDQVLTESGPNDFRGNPGRMAILEYLQVQVETHSDSLMDDVAGVICSFPCSPVSRQPVLYRYCCSDRI